MAADASSPWSHHEGSSTYIELRRAARDDVDVDVEVLAAVESGSWCGERDDCPWRVSMGLKGRRSSGGRGHVYCRIGLDEDEDEDEDGR